MATREGYSTITISEELKGRLKSMKTHPRQSYEEVITRVLDERDKMVENRNIEPENELSNQVRQSKGDERK